MSLAIHADRICKRFQSGASEIIAVNDVSLSVERGEFVAIMGPSGSGKSSLMQCLAGLDSPTSGRCWIGDTEITGLPDAELTRIRREQIGFIFQEFNLLPTMTARENIVLPLKLAKRPVDKQYLHALVEILGIADRLSHRPAELSGGQQQRVAVARALLSKPTVIFADEPTGALDQDSSRNLIEVLVNGVRYQGQTVVMVTHDPMVAQQASRIIAIQDGKVLNDGLAIDHANSTQQQSSWRRG